MASKLRTINTLSPEGPAIEREEYHENGMTDISRTLFLPLFFRAQETLENGIINDPTSVQIVRQLDYDNRNFHLDREMQLIISLRTMVLDRIVGNYIADRLAEGQQPVIVNLGAGLDTRQQRFPNARWYHVDLATPMSMRRRLLPQNDATLIDGSAFEPQWAERVVETDNVLIIVEGVLMYFDEATVRTLFEIMHNRFHHFWVAFDALAPRYTTLRAHQSIDVDRAGFKWGINSANDLETWHLDYHPMSEYGYYTEYLDHYDNIAPRYRLIRFDATHKVYVVSHP